MRDLLRNIVEIPEGESDMGSLDEDFEKPIHKLS
jgi:hypothetical protein